MRLPTPLKRGVNERVVKVCLVFSTLQKSASMFLICGRKTKKRKGESMARLASYALILLPVISGSTVAGSPEGELHLLKRAWKEQVYRLKTNDPPLKAFVTARASI